MGFQFLSDFQKKVLESKYCHTKEDNTKETFDEAIERVATNVNKYDSNCSEEMAAKTIQYITQKDFSPAGGVWRAAGAKTRKISAVNCTTMQIAKDSIEDIFESISIWSRIASYGQGNGIDISGLRPRGAATHNCAHTSTGAVSFLQCYDSSMQVIGAENRRGATKPDIWIYHPDSPEFIRCKNDISKLTSQNISVKVDSAFMEAVEKDEEIELSWERKDNKVYVGKRLFDEDSLGPDIEVSKKVKAKELFEQISFSAWLTGEPGIEFWDISEKYSNSNYHPDKKYHVVSTNGCSEQKLDPLNTCILSSINLYNMPSLGLNWQEWLEDRTSFGIRFLDNVVEMEYQEDRSPHPLQKKKLRKMTRIGLGFTGLGDWFLKNKIQYGSKESIEVLDKIMKVFSESAYRTSIALGKERGSFEEFNPNWFCKSAFVQRLCKLTNLKLEDFTHMRHVAVLSIAPTGTLSLVTGSDSSGAEPMFAPYMGRRERATTGDYITHYIYTNRIMEYCHNLNIPLTKENVDAIVKENPEWVYADQISPLDKIKLMKVIYNYIDSGVSITYNLPQTATTEDIRKIYFEAWKAELKSVTVYRDKSREGILLKEDHKQKQSNGVIKHDSVKRPKELHCDIHQLQVDKRQWVVLVGLLDNDPYEVFCGLQENVKIPKKSLKGKLIKEHRGAYTLELEDGYAFNVGQVFQNLPSESALARMISISLRHGVDIQFVVQQLEKSDGDMMSFSKTICRVLKKYIAEGAKVSGETCPQCGKSDLIRNAGCVQCGSLDCGWSRC